MKKASNSSTNLQNNRKLNIDSKNIAIKDSKKRTSDQNFLFHEKIYDKLNNGTVLHFICESKIKKEKKIKMIFQKILLKWIIIYQ